jgi:hypothetical protein
MMYVDNAIKWYALKAEAKSGCLKRIVVRLRDDEAIALSVEDVAISGPHRTREDARKALWHQQPLLFDCETFELERVLGGVA